MPGKQVQLDTTKWSPGPIDGPILGGLSAIFLAVWGNLDPNFPSWAIIALAVIGCLATVAVAYRRRRRNPGGKIDKANIIYRCACWIGFAAWTYWTIEYDWSFMGGMAGGITVLIIGLFAAGVFLAAVTPDRHPDAQAGLAAAAAVDAATGDFQEVLLALIVKFLNIRHPHEYPRVVKVKDWPNKAGHTWLVEGAPGTAFQWKRLNDIQVELAAALRLPQGCPVTAKPAPSHQGAALLDISTLNEMSVNIPYPDFYGPRSIRDEFPIGLLLTKERAMVELYQSAGISAGQRGSGKTVLLQGITGHLVRCTDALVWHVDLNGGGMSAAWTSLFALGQLPVPVVDWVAPTASVAKLLAEVGSDIAKDRKRRYQQMTIKHNTDVLPVGDGVTVCAICDMPHPPAIQIIVDEGGEAFGDDAIREAREAAQALRELQRIGRAMCVNVLFSVQRATADYVSSQMKKGVALQICTRVLDDSELAYLFDWNKGLTAEQLREPGQAYMRRGNGPIQMLKIYQLLPAQITKIAEATWRLRPKLDKRALQVAGARYERRWEHPDVLTFMAGLRGEDIEAIPASASVHRTGAPVGMHEGQEAVDDMHAALQQVRDARRTTPPGPASGQAPSRPAPRPAGGQPGRQGPPPSSGPLPPTATPPRVNPAAGYDLDRVNAEFDNIAGLPTADGSFIPPVSAPPAAGRPADGDPAEDKSISGRVYDFVIMLLKEAGPAGLKTEAITFAVATAELTRRRQAVSEALAEAKRKGAAFQKDDAYATWVSSDYAAS